MHMGAFMALPRYQFHDLYIIGELCDRYDAADSAGRIALLNGLYFDPEYVNTSAVPYELAARAASDSKVEVRRWLARHGRYLKYEHDGPAQRESLIECLSRDDDPLVKAALRENRDIYLECTPFRLLTLGT
jgi:hypothetical protein